MEPSTPNESPKLSAIWAEVDPAYCDGEGKESFATLLQRAKAALFRLEAMPEDTLAYVFSRGHFI